MLSDGGYRSDDHRDVPPARLKEFVSKRFSAMYDANFFVSSVVIVSIFVSLMTFVHNQRPVAFSMCLLPTCLVWLMPFFSESLSNYRGFGSISLVHVLVIGSFAMLGVLFFISTLLWEDAIYLEVGFIMVLVMVVIVRIRTYAKVIAYACEYFLTDLLPRFLVNNDANTTLGSNIHFGSYLVIVCLFVGLALADFLVAIMFWLQLQSATFDGVLAFSAIEGWKHFLRMDFASDGLSLTTIGVIAVPEYCSNITYHGVNGLFHSAADAAWLLIESVQLV